jgi:hypothetical protein
MAKSTGQSTTRLLGEAQLAAVRLEQPELSAHQCRLALERQMAVVEPLL